MNTKTMEGLSGASANMKLVNTPMRVFREAKRRGDTATMERAMGYAGQFFNKAEEYKNKAGEGTREEAEEIRERAEEETKEIIEKRKEEREKLEERIETGKETGKETDKETDTVEISEEGRILLEQNSNLYKTDYQGKKPAGYKEAVIYNKTGETVQQVQDINIPASI